MKEGILLEYHEDLGSLDVSETCFDFTFPVFLVSESVCAFCSQRWFGAEHVYTTTFFLGRPLN